MDWRWPLVGAIIGINLVGVAITVAAFFVSYVGADWTTLAEAGRRFYSGNLYDWDIVGGAIYNYLYSPLAAPLFGLIPGYVVWVAAHFAVLLTLPRIVALATVLAWPFWTDIYLGGIMTFAFVAAWHAVQCRRLGVLAFFTVFLLVPRPLYVPVLVWVLWKQPRGRLPFAGMAIASILGVLATGYASEWVDVMLFRAPLSMTSYINLGPSRLIGAIWIPIGLGLSAWLTWKGRVGLASLCASPYWLPYYGLMILLDFPVRTRHRPGWVAHSRIRTRIRTPAETASP